MGKSDVHISYDKDIRYVDYEISERLDIRRALVVGFDVAISIKLSLLLSFLHFPTRRV